MNKKDLWIGIGIGFAAGGIICGTTCYCVSKKVEQRNYEKRVSREKKFAYSEGKKSGYENGYSAAVSDSVNNKDEVIKAAYDKGVEDTLLETQKWMDENLIQVDTSDPEAIQKAIEASKSANESVSEGKKAEKSPEEDEKRLTEEDYGVKNEPEPPKIEHFKKSGLPEVLSGRKYSIQLSDNTVLTYPIEIFCDTNGFLGPAQARENLREYEKDPRKLKLVWEAMNWGTYMPEYDDGIPPAEVINNFDISIDDVSRMLDEAADADEEQTMETERYLDLVERYRDNPVVALEVISAQDFEEEARLDRVYIDYYALDNTFVQPLDNDKPLEDPITDLGYSDGNALFKLKKLTPDDPDPDVIYVRNLAQHFVAAITRYNKSSTGLTDGSAYLNGETGVVGGTSGV